VGLLIHFIFIRFFFYLIHLKYLVKLWLRKSRKQNLILFYFEGNLTMNTMVSLKTALPSDLNVGIFIFHRKKLFIFIYLFIFLSLHLQ